MGKCIFGCVRKCTEEWARGTCGFRWMFVVLWSVRARKGCVFTIPHEGVIRDVFVCRGGVGGRREINERRGGGE